MPFARHSLQCSERGRVRYNLAMRKLILLRHAKSNWDDETLSDHDRPLAARGERDAPRMGVLLAQKQLIPDLIISSTACRARSTAHAVAESAGFDGRLIETESLYHSSPGQILSVLNREASDESCVMLVGHNPGMEMLASSLAGSYQVFPTAAIGVFECDVMDWSSFDLGDPVHLIGLWRPKEI